jgi:hypothetical protein
MKSKNYLTIFLMLMLMRFNAQEFFTANDSTYPLMYSKFLTLTPDSTFDSQYNKARRTLAILAGKVGNNGSFYSYAAAVKQFNDNATSNAFIPPIPNSINFGNWKELGPYSNNSYPYGTPSNNALNNGRLIKTQVDGDDLTGNTIYALSDNGGLFKTTDGGQNWINFHTDFNFGFISCTEFLLYKEPSTNKKFIYLALGNFTSELSLLLHYTEWN